MNKLVGDIFKAELLGAGAYIPFFEPVGFKLEVVVRNEHEGSNIEFSFIIEEWVGDVFLYDMSFLFAILVKLFQT